MPDTLFAEQLIQWHQQHGRHDLPWQHTRDPYAIWISEIMLQQTQVSVVVPYYQRFMSRFPSLADLACADQELVLQYWSGLGYYSRARNLHRAAHIVMHQYAGVFPQHLEAVKQLPGIGRSTAAAILAFAHGQRQAIMDGNVKRVLTRYFGIQGWPGQPSVETELWNIAERLLPETGIETYTQGLMDLGATLCKRNKPDCHLCPFSMSCVAYCNELTAQLPTPKPRKTIPDKYIVMLLMMDRDHVLLEKRPPSGVWGGLWSLPEIAVGLDAQQIALHQYGLITEKLDVQPALTHAFSHFRLHITPQPLQVIAHASQTRQSAVMWLNKRDAPAAALPAAIKKLFARPFFIRDHHFRDGK